MTLTPLRLILGALALPLVLAGCASTPGTAPATPSTLADTPAPSAQSPEARPAPVQQGRARSATDAALSAITKTAYATRPSAVSAASTAV